MGPSNQSSSYEWKSEAGELESEKVMWWWKQSVDFEGGGNVSLGMQASSQTWKGKEIDSPLETPEEYSSFKTLISDQRDPFQTSDSRTVW